MKRGMTVLVRGLALLLGIVWAGTVLSAEWETQFDEGGVRIDTRDVDNSAYQAFRATAKVAAHPEAVLARLQDIDSYPDWFPDTIEARRVQTGDATWINYVRTDAPWPVKDRDAVYTQRLERDGDNLRIVVGVAPDTVPESKDAVRIRAAAGHWELVASEGGTAIHWEFHVEPGGNIPSSLVNARVVETPKGALQSLKAHFAARS
ncbi:START domain-containing protein [Congregibacter sp.]|uniref:START domain-containing protein n=1 Tax=Congregibacter sp. TaxID=2744308 RepID=UPI003F6D87C2